MINSHVTLLVGMKKGSLKIVGQRVYKFENKRFQKLKEFVKTVGYRATADLIFVTATFPYAARIGSTHFLSYGYLEKVR